VNYLTTRSFVSADATKREAHYFETTSQKPAVEVEAEKNRATVRHDWWLASVWRKAKG